MQCPQQIAILLATYNGGRYLREQLDSILEQSFADWHLYVHDDGSVDDTVAILRDYAERYPDRITLLNYPPQGGACANFFSLLEAVEARYYMFCDQDDVWMPHKIQTSLDRMLQEEQKAAGRPVIVHADLMIVDSTLQVIDTSFVRNQRIRIEKVKHFLDYAYTNTVTGCAMLFNAQAARCVKVPRTAARMHDSWLTLSVVAEGGVVSFIDEPLIYYRQHEGNALGAKELEKMNLCVKLRNALTACREIVSHYREMNSIRRTAFPRYLWARMRYKL